VARPLTQQACHPRDSGPQEGARRPTRRSNELSAPVGRGRIASKDARACARRLRLGGRLIHGFWMQRRKQGANTLSATQLAAAILVKPCAIPVPSGHEFLDSSLDVVCADGHSAAPIDGMQDFRNRRWRRSTPHGQRHG